MEQKLTRIGAGQVFELCSARGYLGIEVLGGRERNASEGGMQQKALEISRPKANRGCWIVPAWDGGAWPPWDVWGGSGIPESGLHVVCVSRSLGRGVEDRTLLWLISFEEERQLLRAD